MEVFGSLAARELGVSVRTLADWADAGKIRFTRSAAGWRLYPWGEVRRLKAKLTNTALAAERHPGVPSSPRHGSERRK